MVAPARRPRHPFLDWPGPLPFAHRGGASDAAENTMAAFEYAVGLGYAYVETDVHATADGVLVAFHDVNLKRTCGIDRRIDQMSWADVQRARVDGREPIPQLEELLGTWTDLRVNIDCKADSAVHALVAAIKRTESIERVCVGAFNDLRVRRVRAALGERLCTALGPGGVSRLRFGRSTGGFADAAQVPVRSGRLVVITPPFLERAHSNGIQVHAWTIDDAAEIERLLDMGVDGIMTDRPTVLRDVLERRGQWFSR